MPPSPCWLPGRCEAAGCRPTTWFASGECSSVSWAPTGRSRESRHPAIAAPATAQDYSRIAGPWNWTRMPGSSRLPAASGWTYQDLPLGTLCLPGLRWALRRHHLQDDAATRGLLRQYLRSAASLSQQVERVLDRLQPRALVVFNGLMYPEAVARTVARRRGIPVVTHEVGLKPFSAFFSPAQAPFRAVEMPADYHLGDAQRQALE